MLVAVGTKDDIAGSPHELAALIPTGAALDIPDRDHMVAVGDKVFKAAFSNSSTSAMKHLQPATATFIGAAGNTLVADVFGEAGPPVLLLHGGGQTRHAWRPTAEHRAHGRHRLRARPARPRRFEWVADGTTRSGFRGRRCRRGRELTRRTGVQPIVIGASLGGIASLLAEGTAERTGRGPLFASLVLVDVTPRVDRDGVAKIHGFMREHATEGFANVDEAAAAVAEYLPHRPRPRSHQGLKKNLRLSPDGRWRWHWDPRLLQGRAIVSRTTTECSKPR